MPVNWFDVVLVVVLIWSAVAGLRSGLARVVIGLIATLAGLIAGFWFYRVVAANLQPWVRTAALADIFGFLIIFMSIVILGSVLAAVLSRIFQSVGLSWVNHLLGGIAGFLRGALLIAALLDLLVAYSPSPMPEFLERSRVLPYAGEVSAWLVEMAPRELKDAFTQQMENLKQLWRKPRPDHSQVV